MSVATERQILEREIGRLEAEGYDVFVEPKPPVAPSFLANYVPDAIAIGRGKNIILEVGGSDPAHDRRLKDVASMMLGHPDWELRVVWAQPTAGVQTLPIQSIEQIQSTVSEIKSLSRGGSFQAAFLLGWAALEASSRALQSEEFARPQTPGRLIEVLTSEGHLAESAAHRLRALSEKRNRLVHGVLDTPVGEGEVSDLVDMLNGIVQRVAA